MTIKAELWPDNTLGTLGSDLDIVNSARVSFDKESEWELEYDGYDAYDKVLSERDKKLIKYLASHGHFTPFTHCIIRMRETVPIFVARQRFKHTVGFSYNEISRRYVSDTPEFFVPKEWRLKADDKKQGSSEEVLTDEGYPHRYELFDEYADLLQKAKDLYLKMTDVNVASEQARMVLPQSMFTSYIVTGSLAAWARAYNLRIDSHAQKEIQDLAKQWGALIEPHFPVSWKELTKKEKE